MNGAAGLWDQRSSVQCNFVSYLLLGLGCCEQADHQIRSNVVASITFGALTKLVTRSQTLNQSDPFDSRTKKNIGRTRKADCVYICRARWQNGSWPMENAVRPARVPILEMWSRHIMGTNARRGDDCFGTVKAAGAFQ